MKIGGNFALTDHHGQPVSAATYHGRHMMIFFGFTHCRKVCPETLAKMSKLLDQVDPDGANIAPLYITVDPERDDPATMRAFLEARFPRFTGLTGTADAINAVRSAFRVFAEKAADEEDPEGYAVPHSALVYLTDREGRYRFHFNDGVDEPKAVGKLNELLSTG